MKIFALTKVVSLHDLANLGMLIFALAVTFLVFYNSEDE